MILENINCEDYCRDLFSKLIEREADHLKAFEMPLISKMATPLFLPFTVHRSLFTFSFDRLA